MDNEPAVLPRVVHALTDRDRASGAREGTNASPGRKGCSRLRSSFGREGGEAEAAGLEEFKDGQRGRRGEPALFGSG